ncbi:MAG: hypothetical protein LBQ43_00700 [Holosporales bacterium]|jgi:hypothetical protein|nr:hypothetical protein [Holosporales bacterium]
MLCGVDVIDKLLLLAVICCCGAISYFDIKQRSFPALWLVMLAIIGGIWCVKQEFIPAALIPIGVVMALLAAVNRYWKEVIGNGDIFLFLVSGLFVPVGMVDLFMIFCGGMGLVTCAVMRTTNIPFSCSICVSIIIVLCLLA